MPVAANSAVSESLSGCHSHAYDAETEAAETQVHVEIAFRHSYLRQEVFAELDDACDKILAQIVKMIDHADRWAMKPRRRDVSA